MNATNKIDSTLTGRQRGFIRKPYITPQLAKHITSTSACGISGNRPIRIKYRHKYCSVRVAKSNPRDTLRPSSSNSKPNEPIMPAQNEFQPSSTFLSFLSAQLVPLVNATVEASAEANLMVSLDIKAPKICPPLALLIKRPKIFRAVLIRYVMVNVFRPPRRHEAKQFCGECLHNEVSFNSCDNFCLPGQLA